MAYLNTIVKNVLSEYRKYFGMSGRLNTNSLLEGKTAKLMLIHANVYYQVKAPRNILTHANTRSQHAKTNMFLQLYHTIAELSSSLFAFFAEASLAALLSLMES